MTDLATLTVPSRIADLGFSLAIPRDWISHELPPETPNFDDPTQLLALALVTAQHSAIVLAVAARPAYAEGTLSDWGRWLLDKEAANVRAMGEGRLGALSALVAEATKDSEIGTLVLRTAFAEDGARLINVTLTAPELLADAVLPIWHAALESFSLSTPRGATVPVYPPVSAPVQPPVSESEQAAPAAVTESADATHPMLAFALAEDAGTFDQEHAINAGLLQKGTGFVPKIVEVDMEGRCATLASASLVAELKVPFGWHPLDDGKRLLLLDPSNAVQVSLEHLPMEGRTIPEIIDALEAETRESYPAPEFARRVEGRITALGVRNIHDGAQPLDQYHMLMEGRRADLVLRARVTATPERSVAAVNFGEQLLLSVRFFESEKPAPAETKRERKQRRKRLTDPGAGPAAWWATAQALEEEGRIDEAVALVDRECKVQGTLISQAELWARTMSRRSEASDREGARQAWRKSRDLAYGYAASATSGGEGAALSRERDAFLARLGPEPL